MFNGTDGREDLHKFWLMKVSEDLRRTPQLSESEARWSGSETPALCNFFYFTKLMIFGHSAKIRTQSIRISSLLGYVSNT